MGKVFAKFRPGNFSLVNAPWSGRPAEVDSDQNINLKQATLYHAGHS